MRIEARLEERGSHFPSNQAIPGGAGTLRLGARSRQQSLRHLRTWSLMTTVT